jgi:hypothetical protein
VKEEEVQQCNAEGAIEDIVGERLDRQGVNGVLGDLEGRELQVESTPYIWYLCHKSKTVRHSRGSCARGGGV